MMKSYKGWTAEERRKSLILTKKAIASWEIPHQSELWCNRCGQKKWIIDYHNENYSHPTKYLEPLCFRCHIIHHSERRNPKMCKLYWERIKEWKVYEPVFTRSFEIFKTEYYLK